MANIDTATAFGSRAERRLRTERIGGLVSVSPGGTPRPIPVWFLWEGESILLYSRPGTPKLRNIAANPRVALHLDGDGWGGDVVVVTGEAEVLDGPPANEVEAYVEKYAWGFKRLGRSATAF